jgi:acyl-CoA reductase-like NAD-dependent aldehyde dehydrogenase
MNVPHLPVLRLGRAYESLDKLDIQDHRHGDLKAVLSTVNAGIIRKDLQRVGESRAALTKFTCAQLIEICAQAGEHFHHGTLPLGDRGHTQSAAQYIETLSTTSGLPHVLIHRNMAKIHHALTNMKTVLNGLTRGLELGILDAGHGEQFGARLTFCPTTSALGLVMPSNSPAVNSLWLPAIALKTPVIIKPGREEPWTPYRLIQAFIAAGAPAEAFGFYPTDHEGAREILRGCGRALLFGDRSTTFPYANNPAVQIHGPGLSKIIIGDDCIEQWRDYLDVLVSAISDNGGRSCINASAIVVPKYAAEIADALAQKLGPVQPARADDPNARLAGFANPKMAESINAQIEEGLKTPGAIDITAKYRTPLAPSSVSLAPTGGEGRGEGARFVENRSDRASRSGPLVRAADHGGERQFAATGGLGSRQVTFDGGVYLRPTIVLCDNFQHPLANKEFLFPYASLVEVPQKEMLQQMGYSLAVTAITKDRAFIQQLLNWPEIERLNIGPLSTLHVSWDQPHEGNMFEFLWKRRSLEHAW